MFFLILVYIAVSKIQGKKNVAGIFFWDAIDILNIYLRYLLIFLKFVQAVIPTIEYDYTRHFSM